MITTLRHNARAAMKDGHPPTKAVLMAHEMKHGSGMIPGGMTDDMDGVPNDDADAMARGGKLSYQHRKRMKSSEFALPGKREGGKGGYPIPDASHARNALARVSQFGSSAQKAEVRSKVHAKFPGIGKK